jgi:hypothetical protein
MYKEYTYNDINIHIKNIKLGEMPSEFEEFIKSDDKNN